MPNKKGGKKYKKNKKKIFIDTKVLRKKEEGQEYAQIIKCNGNCRFQVKVFDGKERLAILCGTMRKRGWLSNNDIVLVSLRDFEDSKCDIIDRYDEIQFYKLKDLGEIPESIKLNNDEYLSDNEEEYFDYNIDDNDNDSDNDSDIDLSEI